MTDSRSDPTIVQRLMQALEADTAVELARALGLPVTDVEQALAKGQVPDEWVRICAAETGCNADWLFFGRGPCASRWWSPVPCPPASCWKMWMTMWT